MVASEYWLEENAPQLKDWIAKEKAFFAGRYYCCWFTEKVNRDFTLRLSFSVRDIN